MPLAEKGLRLGQECWSGLEAQGFGAEEVPKGVTRSGPKGTKAQIALKKLLMVRHRLPPLGIVLDQGRIKGPLLRHKDEQVVEEFQRLLRRKPASQPEEPQMIGQAQQVMRATSGANLVSHG